ncbi:SGNH/GDSL hydrolase family protein [Nocardia goodfellowii]|uniref:Lysophospholipase L1-like esterase n=1 Tax=Nocardia goodfellowii TaxID=882446 RepID=A0ABS4QN84_9NOCA|nr:SGNH/GDSL hydrolase family protein [Nocardia goodfellowii]MBP2192489.1 lysophospholipase L1-like esterase [Nocardia goodfellowii]
MPTLNRTLAGACVSLAGAILLAPSASAAPAYHEYVALGDSWSADSTLSNISTQHVPLGCGQSAGNYPKQVAAALSVAVFRDATCGAATTVHMTTPQRLPGSTNAPQFERLTPTTDLVTVGIGGNDAGLAEAITSCLTMDPTASPCQTSWVPGGVDAMSANIRAAEPAVIAVLNGIKARAPHARILLLDYLKSVGERGCFASIPISDTDAAWIGRKKIELNAMLARAAAATGVELVDTYSTSGGHDVCQPPGTRWVEGLIPMSQNPPGPAVPFHPNQLGADHQASSVLAALGQ